RAYGAPTARASRRVKPAAPEPALDAATPVAAIESSNSRPGLARRVDRLSEGLLVKMLASRADRSSQGDRRLFTLEQSLHPPNRSLEVHRRSWRYTCTL